MAHVLLVSQMVPYLPCHDGFRVIPAHLLRCLSRRHTIHLIALGTRSEPLEWARGYCASVTLVETRRPSLARRALNLVRPEPAELATAVRTQLHRAPPDVLHLEGPSLAGLARLAPAGTRTVLSAHDALSLRQDEFALFARSRLGRALHRMKAARERRFERRWYPRVGHVVVTSASDRDVLASVVPAERLTVIPNGVDLGYLDYRPEPVPDRLVFTGNMSWPPNADAAAYFARDVLPLVRARRPETSFWIVGADPSPEVRTLASRPGVHVTGTVPDLREWIRSAAVYVSPLRYGAGVKNKVLEAMALGAPMVATSRSLTGTPLVHEQHLLLADGTAPLAAAVARLLEDAALRESLSRAARRHVADRYSWDDIAARFERLWTPSPPS